jgi:cephalosporin hydroxylase
MEPVRRLLFQLKKPIWRAGRQRVIDLFHKYFYLHRREETWMATRWMGVRAQKNPLDLWIYQEIVHETRPDLLIETGTYDGGSALFFASLFDLIGEGRVLSIDVAPQKDLPQHPRIRYLAAGSLSEEALSLAGEMARTAGRVMVSLDSCHTEAHVLAECRAYGPLVTPGCYMVVEDTNVNGHPVWREHGPGPMEGLRRFLAECPDFEPDRGRERYILTFHPMGWLRRKTG